MRLRIRHTLTVISVFLGTSFTADRGAVANSFYRRVNVYMGRPDNSNSDNNEVVFMAMNPHELEEKKMMVLSMCICAGCPSWVECGEKGGFCFQTMGNSTCITGEKGCIRDRCPVTAEMVLTHSFLLRGNIT